MPPQAAKTHGFCSRPIRRWTYSQRPLERAMAGEPGPDAAERREDRTALGSTAAAATNIVLAPVWLVFWLQKRLQSLGGGEQRDWFYKDAPHRDRTRHQRRRAGIGRRSSRGAREEKGSRPRRPPAAPRRRRRTPCRYRITDDGNDGRALVRRGPCGCRITDDRTDGRAVVCREVPSLFQRMS